MISRQRLGVALSIALVVLKGMGAEPKRIEKPALFKTLVNPECSHCVDEAKRRARDLRADDRVLAWTRGKYDGGAVPLRFFLVPYRVISDTYGVWVYDADAGFVRGYEPSLDFTFNGWRNGVIVIKHRDGTLFSALTGAAFDGPRKGSVLKPLATIETDWGYWLQSNPGTVAYNMFDKYSPHDLPTGLTSESKATRPAADPRLKENEMVYGLAIGNEARAYPLALLATNRIIVDRLGTQDVVVFWFEKTRTAAAYAPRMEAAGIPEKLTLEHNAQVAAAPFMDKETFSHWSIEGRAMEGPLKGKTLVWLPGVQCKWFAWAAENPKTEIYPAGRKQVAQTAEPPIARLIEGERLDWDSLAKTTGYIVSKSANGKMFTLFADSDKTEHTIAVTPQTEFHVEGAWGGAGDFREGQNVYVLATRNARKEWMAAHALVDELSMQAMSRPLLLTESKSNRGRLVFRDGKERKPAVELRTDAATQFQTEKREPLKPGQPYYYRSQRQSGTNLALEILDESSFSERRQRRLNEQLRTVATTGLAATVITNLADRVVIMVRRADAWFARSLHQGDSVRIAGAPGGAGESVRVADITPDYSRVRLSLETRSGTSETLVPGHAVSIFATISPGIDLVIPPDLGRRKGRAERIDWFLSTIYCPCGMIGTACAGHWNTLAACKIHGCGMPNLVTKQLEEWIKAGKDDSEIFAMLRKQHGRDMLVIHQN